MGKKKRRKGKQAAQRKLLEWMKSLATDILSGLIQSLILAAIHKLVSK